MAQAGAVAAGQWYLSQNNKRYGPLSVGQLKQLAARGQIDADAWVLQAESDVWVRATAVVGALAAKPAPAPRPAAPAPRSAVPSVSRPTPLPGRPPTALGGAAGPSSIVLIKTDCPSCGAGCRLPKPTGPTVHRCPRCCTPFRIALTSVGILTRAMPNPSQPTVHRASIFDTDLY
jgi:hypothetical protein